MKLSAVKLMCTENVHHKAVPCWQGGTEGQKAKVSHQYTLQISGLRSALLVLHGWHLAVVRNCQIVPKNRTISGMPICKHIRVELA